MTGRLNLWDFDDVLARSSKAVEKATGQYPSVAEGDWYRDPDWSTVAVKMTEPEGNSWTNLHYTPGYHAILTGRVLPAVMVWLTAVKKPSMIQTHIDRYVAAVYSVAGYPKGTPGGAAARKAEFIGRVAPLYDEVHVYDDSPAVLTAVQALGLPKVFPHQVIEGKIVNGRWVRSMGPPT